MIIIPTDDGRSFLKQSFFFKTNKTLNIPHTLRGILSLQQIFRHLLYLGASWRYLKSNLSQTWFARTAILQIL